jgi:O-antigen ligase
VSAGSRLRGLPLLGVVLCTVLAPWPFASVEPFWWALACASLLAFAALAWLVDDRSPAPPREAAIAAAAAPLVALISLVPLPMGWVAALSPGVPDALRRATATSPEWTTLSLHSPAALDALIVVSACGAAAWLVARGAVDRRTRSVLAGAFVVGGVLVAVFGLVQRLVDPDPQRMFWSVRIYEVGTPFGPYVNRNHFGGAMLLFTGVAAGRAIAGWSAMRVRSASLWTSAAVVTSLSLAATTSRGAILGLGALGLFLIVVAARRHRRRLLFAAVGIVALLVALLVAAGLFDELAGRLFHVYGRWRNRFLVQADAMRVFTEFPVAGTGAGSFPWVYHAFQRVDDARHFNDAHSDWVQILMDTGALGIIAIGAVAVPLVRSAVRASRVTAPERWHALGAVAGCLGIAVHGFFETNLHIPANALLAAVATGLAYGSSMGETCAAGAASDETGPGVIA